MQNFAIVLFKKILPLILLIIKRFLLLQILAIVFFDKK